MNIIQITCMSAALAAILAAATACGPTAATSQPVTASSVQVTSSSFASAIQVASAYGMTQFSAQPPQPGFGITSTGVAFYHGRYVIIDVFVTAAARQHLADEASSVSSRLILRGADWMVYNA